MLLLACMPENLYTYIYIYCYFHTTRFNGCLVSSIRDRKMTSNSRQSLVPGTSFPRSQGCLVGNSFQVLKLKETRKKHPLRVAAQ